MVDVGALGGSMLRQAQHRPHSEGVRSTTELRRRVVPSVECDAAYGSGVYRDHGDGGALGRYRRRRCQKTQRQAQPPS